MERILKKRADLNRRHQRARKKVAGTPARPRLSVFRSIRHMAAQFIDDQVGKTLLAVSTLGGDFSGDAYGGNVKAAEALGKLAAEKAKAAGIAEVVFDRGGRKYHGRVKAFAEAARKGGLVF